MITFPLSIDDFLLDYPRWRKYFDGAVYEDVINPADGVKYPGICQTIPQELRDEIEENLLSFTTFKRINYIFARLTVQGANPPHWAHNDLSMGAGTLILYLNREEHCQGGTVLLNHVDSKASLETLQQDTNDLTKWVATDGFDMKPNRAAIFPSSCMHAALPREGFGNSSLDGRLILGAFFE